MIPPEIPSPKGHPATLDSLRGQALLHADAAIDPLIRQQYRDLAASYDHAASELREKGVAIVPSHSLNRMAWRSVPLWSSNDK
jgi:hypothetical protein